MTLRIASLARFMGLSFLLACEMRGCSSQAPATRLDPAKGSAAQGAPQVALSLVARGPNLITDVEFVPGVPGLFAITSQKGEAQLYSLPTAPGQLAQPRGRLLRVEVDSESELGLLSVAFHPEYARNGRLFVHYNPKGKQMTRIAELALPSAELGKREAVQTRVLLEQKQPFSNHNGGELAFGPDGKLYVGLGDGGSGGDPQGNAQRLSTVLGKILRLDVDGEQLVPADNPFVDTPDARPEVFAYGLRNPWKISFDARGRLIAADVGQNSFEEIDIVERGANLGWNVREARHCFQPAQGCASAGLLEPIFEYGRDRGQSVTGGYVYTGETIAALRGRYVFADFLSHRLWALQLPERAGELASGQELGVFEVIPAALARDPQGELYVSDYGSGNLYKLVAGQP